MQTEKINKLEAKIREAKQEIMALGAIRPGHLSAQFRTSDKSRTAYTQLSYTFKKRGHTDYIRAADLDRIKQEVENYKIFKLIIERIYELSIELSKAKSIKHKNKRQPQNTKSN